MNKISRLITSLVLGFSLLLIPVKTLALAPLISSVPADVTNSCLIANNAQTINSGGPISAGGQQFTAVKNRITKITAFMKFSAINKVRLNLYKIGNNNAPLASSSVIDTNNASGYQPDDAYTVSFDLNATVIPGEEYLLLLIAVEGTANWKYVENDGSCDPTGFSGINAQTTDMSYMVQGYDYVAPGTTPTTTPAPTTTPDTTSTTTTPTTVVAPSVLATPQNFRLDRDLEIEKIFAWDKNTETDLTGYVMYIYDGETLVETIDIPDKELDNYNLILSEHPLLVKDKEYSSQLVAKTAKAISEKSAKVLFTFSDRNSVTTTTVAKTKSSWITGPYVLGGLGVSLFLLIGFLIFLEKKFHGFANFFQKIKGSPKKEY